MFKTPPIPWLTRLGLLTISVFITAAACEVALRFFDLNLTSQGAQLGLKIQFDSEMLYRNIETQELGVAINGERITGGEDLNSSTPEVLMLGDSFTFGAGVLPEESFPYLVQQRVGSTIRVRNLGVIGYGPDQAIRLAQMKLTRRRSRPQIQKIVLSVFAGNDLKDLLSNRLVACNQAGQCEWSSHSILAPHVSSLRLANILRHAALGKNVIPPKILSELFNDRESPASQLSQADLNTAKLQLQFIFAELSRLDESAKTEIVIIPSYSSYVRADEYLLNVNSVKEACASTKHVCHDVTSHLNQGDYLHGDNHLTPGGNAKLALFLADLLQ